MGTGVSPMVIAACLLMGVGIGMVLGHTTPGALVGLGAGMLVQAWMRRGRAGEP